MALRTPGSELKKYDLRAVRGNYWPQWTYAYGGNILSIDGRTLAELDLAENEYVYGLSYSQDGTVLTATIVSSEETERIVRLTLP